MLGDLVEVRIDLVLGEAAEGGVALGDNADLELRLLELLRQDVLQTRNAHLNRRLLTQRRATLLQLLVQPVICIVFLRTRTRAIQNINN